MVDSVLHVGCIKWICRWQVQCSCMQPDDVHHNDPTVGLRVPGMHACDGGVGATDTKMLDVDYCFLC